ncbi:hypothetical protein DAMA08_016270 [Martiniozyma asiatica (nom. inval.)]|nr:hypothetical protein DAMA08_016270 [Martiniozyma asiatica]
MSREIFNDVCNGHLIYNEDLLSGHGIDIENDYAIPKQFTNDSKVSNTIYAPIDYEQQFDDRYYQVSSYENQVQDNNLDLNSNSNSNFNGNINCQHSNPYQFQYQFQDQFQNVPQNLFQNQNQNQFPMNNLNYLLPKSYSVQSFPVTKTTAITDLSTSASVSNLEFAPKMQLFASACESTSATGSTSRNSTSNSYPHFFIPQPNQFDNYNDNYYYKPISESSPFQSIQQQEFFNDELDQYPSVVNRFSSLSNFNPSKRKLSSDDEHRKQSIAGIIYNSTAVYKRLKPSNDFIKNEKIKSQGRPFSNDINCRFLLHDDLKSFLSYIDKKRARFFYLFDWSNNDSISNTPSKDSIIMKLLIRNELNGSDLSKIVIDNNDTQVNIKVETNMVADNDKNMNRDNSIDINSIIQFFNRTYDDIVNIITDKNQYYPVQKSIQFDSTTSAIKQERQGKIDSKLNLSGKENKSQFKNQEKIPSLPKITSSINFHKILLNFFSIPSDYIFVKTIRDSNGKILKLESIKPPKLNGEYNYSPEWVKRCICYPRYKSRMNLHLLPTNDDFILYNDIRMLLWDLKGKMTENPENFVESLFKGKNVYININ